MIEHRGERGRTFFRQNLHQPTAHTRPKTLPDNGSPHTCSPFTTTAFLDPPPAREGVLDEPLLGGRTGGIAEASVVWEEDVDV
jgi:hypothetical protein